MIRKIFIGAMLLVALFAAPASAQYPPLVITPPVVSANEEVSVSGQGCAPFQEVIIYLVPGDSTGATAIPAGAVEVGRTTTDANGNFSITFKVPAGTPLGVYTVTASCGTVDQSGTIKVIGAKVVAPPASTPPNLPRTGSNLNGAGMIGAGLLAAGGLVLLASRKRRSSSVPA